MTKEIFHLQIIVNNNKHNKIILLLNKILVKNKTQNNKKLNIKIKKCKLI